MRRLILSVLALACLAAAQLQRFDSTATAVTGQPGSIQLQAVLPGSTVYVCTGTATGATACGTPGTAALFSDIGGTVPLPQPLVADANGEWGFFAASAPLYYTVTPPLSSIGVAYTKNITLGTANAFTFSVPTPAPYAPGSVNVVPVGTTGGTTYYYWVVSDFTIGNSAPSLSAVITNAAGTLSSINYDKVTWTAATGANTYDVLRTTSATAPTGACACAVATAVNALTANDQSNSLSAYTVNTYAGNTTFNITNAAVGAGESKLTFAADHGTQFSVDNLNGASFTTLNAQNIESVRYADQFTGASTPARILAAYGAANSDGGVTIPATMSDGYPTQLWLPTSSFSLGAVIADAAGNLQQCTTAGTSSAWPGPTWNTILGGTTTDGTVVWTRIAGSLFGSVLFDYRTGTQAAPTTTPAPYPYAKVFVPIWDDSANVNPSGTLAWPFQPLNSATPSAFGAYVHESGAAVPTGMFSNVELDAPGIGFPASSNAAAGYFSCTMDSGDQHRGCWGINEGVGTLSTASQLFGNEVNLFNDTGTDSSWNGTSFTAGPYWGFAATNGGGSGGTAGFLAESQGSYGWQYGFWSTGTRSGGSDFECGAIGQTNHEGACMFAAAAAPATSGANKSSLAATFEASAWHAGAPTQYDASLSYIPDTGTDPLIWLTETLSENGIPSGVGIACEANGNCKLPNTLWGGYAGTPSQVTPVSVLGGYSLAYDQASKRETDTVAPYPSSSGDALDACWYDGSNALHCATVLDRNGISYSNNRPVVTAGADGLSAGTITVSSSTTGSHTFTTAYSVAPTCTVTEAGSTPAALNPAVTSSTTAVTVTVAVSGTYAFNFLCVPAVN